MWYLCKFTAHYFSFSFFFFVSASHFVNFSVNFLDWYRSKAISIKRVGIITNNCIVSVWNQSLLNFNCMLCSIQLFLDIKSWCFFKKVLCIFNIVHVWIFFYGVGQNTLRARYLLMIWWPSTLDLKHLGVYHAPFSYFVEKYVRML